VIVNGRLQDDAQLVCEVSDGSASVVMIQISTERRDGRVFGEKRREDRRLKCALYRCICCAAYSVEI
jgi:hypothetical protein